MKVWMRLLALMMALLLGTAALAENMTLTEKIAAAEEEVLQWYEYLKLHLVPETDEEAVRVAEAVTYLEQACANVAIGVSSPVVRLCSAMRTCVEQLYKQGLAWEESGVASYAVAFESARDELSADMSPPCAIAPPPSRPVWKKWRPKPANGFSNRAKWPRRNWKTPSPTCASMPRSWKRALRTSARMWPRN